MLKYYSREELGVTNISTKVKYPSYILYHSRGFSFFSWDCCVATIITFYFMQSDVVLLTMNINKKKLFKNRERNIEEIVATYLQTRKELYGLGKRKNKPFF